MNDSEKNNSTNDSKESTITKKLESYRVWFDCIGMLFLTLMSIFVMMKGNELIQREQKIEDNINSPKFIASQSGYSILPDNTKEVSARMYTRYYIKNIGGEVKNLKCIVKPYIYVWKDNFTYNLADNPILIPMDHYVRDDIGYLEYSYSVYNNKEIETSHITDNEVMFSKAEYYGSSTPSSLDRLSSSTCQLSREMFPESDSLPLFRVVFLCELSYYNYQNEYIVENYVMDGDDLYALDEESKKLFDFADKIKRSSKQYDIEEIFPYIENIKSELEIDDKEELEELIKNFSLYIVETFYQNENIG